MMWSGHHATRWEITMEVNPISMKRIYQSIIGQFIDLIKDGKLKVGDKLPPERTLAEMFNVSRASIREAFSAMEIIGLIEVRPGEGSFVTDLNIGPFISTISPLLVSSESMDADLLDFRKLIEMEAVRLAAMKSDEAGQALLMRTIEKMEEALKENDSIMGAEADIDFHKVLFNLTGNYILIKAAECTAYLLESSVRFNRAKILTDERNAKILLDQHKEIFSAVSRRNAQEAAEIMDRHLNFVREIK
jgi:GntR family transcriptional repressor for pyruvate dehydrogenase complex